MGFKQTPEEIKTYDDFINQIDYALKCSAKYIVIHPLDLARWTVCKFNWYPDNEDVYNVDKTIFLRTTDIKRGEIEVVLSTSFPSGKV